MLNWMAWNTANQMMSTGNMKKGTDALTLKKGLYKSLDDVKEDRVNGTLDKKQVAEAEKAKLMQRFKIEDSQLNN